MDKNIHPEDRAPDPPDDASQSDELVADHQNDPKANMRRKPRVVAFDLVAMLGNDLLIIEEEEY